MRTLVVNAGSSSLKVDLVVDGNREASYDGLPELAPVVDAVGHRIVHGGREFVDPVVIDAAVEKRLHALVDLAPLHQPKSLAALAAARQLLPNVPHVACFDTAFHATLPDYVTTYALPREWRERWDIRRYGFHGLSHAWAAHRAAEMIPGARRVVIAHLGAGASLAAVRNGRSVDTTMGFSPLEGLVMATRSGSVDPGLLLWLEEHEKLSPPAVADALEHRSGLLGLAGTADMQELLTRDDERARLAIDIYLHRLASGIAAMTVSLGGLDALVFTGGVGEHSAAIRRGACARLLHLGVSLDAASNDHRVGDEQIGGGANRVATLVVTSREDLQIALGVGPVIGVNPRTEPALIERHHRSA
jgi:acetate kinase